MTQARSRARLLGNPQFANFGSDLERHIDTWIQSSNPVDQIGLLDEVCTDLLSECFRSVGGNEGTLWLADAEEQNLVAVYNSGPDADQLVGFQQPIGSGIISLVYAQQQPYCENEIEKSTGHDDTLDRKMHLHTQAMIAVPFYFGFQLRGVVSCVQLSPKEESSPQISTGFDMAHVDAVVRTAHAVERLMNATAITISLGLDHG